MCSFYSYSEPVRVQNIFQNLDYIIVINSLLIDISVCTWSVTVCVFTSPGGGCQNKTILKAMIR